MTPPRRPNIVVLLIDDQPIIGEKVRELLEQETHLAFHHCADAHEAIATAAALQPTVILQDLMMPGVDGLELLRQLKRADATREVPVVVLSTTEEPAIKAEAFRLGANDYLVKLPSAVELIARIRYHSEAYRNAAMRRLAMQALTESQEALRVSHAQIARQAAELELRNSFIQKTFGRYLSDEVVSELLDSPEGLRLGGESRVVTILMADLRDFTSTSDRLPATDVMRLLNAYLGAMSRVIAAHRGTIDEFIGDAILAIFGAPLAGDDDAWRAARCALAMQHALQEVNEHGARDGLPLLEMGIALHTGEVVVGNIGSDLRAKYGVVGSNVNLTARIESQSVGGQVLVSEATRAAIGPRARVGRDLRFQAKGFQRDLVAWELTALDGEGGASLPADPGRSTPMRTLDPPRALRFWEAQGKRTDGAPRNGLLLRAGGRDGVLRTAVALAPLADLRILLDAGAGGEPPREVWAKVIDSTGGEVRVRFSRQLDEAARDALH
jgi:adenylate cyclase